MVDHRSRGKPVVAVAALASLAVAGAAHAQTANVPALGVNAAYAHANLSAGAVVRDAAGAPAATDGVVQAGEDASNLSQSGAGGALDTVSGAGSGSGSTVFSGPLAVVTQASRGAGANSPQAGATQTNVNESSQSDNASGESTLSGGVQ
ncbi:MAG TPA: hypothetical protein VGG29_09940 [Caulobacteraceae bacterium]|jgi:hypothetical protein